MMRATTRALETASRGPWRAFLAVHLSTRLVPRGLKRRPPRPVRCEPRPPWAALLSMLSPAPLSPVRCVRESESFIDNLLVRIHLSIMMIRWTGLAPWEGGASIHAVSSTPFPSETMQGHARTVPGTNRPRTKDAGFCEREIPPNFPFERKPGARLSPVRWRESLLNV